MDVAGSSNSECGRILRNAMASEPSLHLEWQTNARASVEAVRSGGKEELLLSFPALCSRLSFRVPLTCDFSRYSLNGELTRTTEMLRFSSLWEVITSLS